MKFPLNRKALLASAVMLSTQATFVQAAGFAIHEHSASAMGTAYAGRASNAQDASIGADNPAAIAFLDKAQITLGTSVVTEGGNFKDGAYSNAAATARHPISPESKNFLKTTPLPYAHYVLPINNKFTFGLNFYSPYGLNLDYDNDFAGRYFGSKTFIASAELQSTFAYKIRDNLSIGVGLGASYLTGKLEQKKAVNVIPGFDLANIDATVKGDDTALAWNMGVLWRPSPMTSLGLAYRGKTTYRLQGRIKIDDPISSGSVVEIDHPGELDVTMPESVVISGTHQLNDKWTVMSDITWTHWDILDSISIVDKNSAATVKGDSYIAMNWRNTTSASVGASYKLNEVWTLKGGYMYDQSPVTNSNRTVQAPDADRNWLTAGASWNATKQLKFDFSAAYIILQNGSVDQGAYLPNGQPDPDYGRVTGKYSDQSAWILAAQMTYLF